MTKPIILTFVPYYLPGYKAGGPVRTIANLVEHLGDEFQFRIITSDRDANDAAPYPSVTQDTWTRVGKARVFYSSPRSRTFKGWQALISNTSYDVLYLNSFFSSDYTIKPLVLRRLGLLPERPVILAPRGEFSKGALAMKWGKKRIYLVLARLIGFCRDLLWQASSQYEVQDIRRMTGPGQSICVAPNLPTSSNGSHGSWRTKQPDKLKVLFLSRITPKKKLDYALGVLKGTGVSVSFDILGPVSDQAYWSYCRQLMSELPDNVAATYLGSVEHDKVFDLMASYDLFFLPTAGENYGHVIQEALSAGTPVLISDRTPWRGLEAKGVGWDVSLERPEQFRRIIEQCSAIAPDAYWQWRGQIASWQSQQGDSQAIALNRTLFREAIEVGERG